MSAWYDLTVALGGAAVPDSTKRVPMTRERAAEVIQYAFKKWLVRRVSSHPLKKTH